MSGQFAASPTRTTARWPVVLVLVLALVALAAVLSTAGGRPRGVVDPGESWSMVPLDGSWSGARLSQSGTAAGTDGGELAGTASVESARLPGARISLGMSAAALSMMPRPAAGLERTWWWRESTMPTDPAQPPRHRIRSVESDGIHLRSQDWENASITLDLLELPRGVAPGARWRSSGVADLSSAGPTVGFSNESWASAPTDPALAARGCLAVESTTVLDDAAGRRWSERSVWCPGEGVVSDSGSMIGSGIDLSWSREPADPDPARLVPTVRVPLQNPSPADLAAWRARPVQRLHGDSAFGTAQRPVLAREPEQLSPTGVLTGPALGGDVLGAYWNQPTAAWQHWWAHPGGEVTTTAMIGRMLLVATSQRQVSAYLAGGSRLWTVDLADVTLAPPTDLGDGLVAVTTVTGEVAVLELATGRIRWRTRPGEGIDRAPVRVGGVLVVADTSPALRGLDLASGKVLWTEKDTGQSSRTPLAAVAGRVVTADGSDVVARDPRTGRLLWSRPARLGFEDLSGLGGRLWLQGADGVELLDPATGASRLRLPGARVLDTDPVCALGASEHPVAVPLRVDDQLQLVDLADGAVRARWPLVVPSDRTRVRIGCTERTLALSIHDPQGDSSLIAIGPAL